MRTMSGRLARRAMRRTVGGVPGVRHVLGVVRLGRAVGELVHAPTARRGFVAGVRTGALVSPRVDRLLALLGWLTRR
jgi:hypothetical protein